MLMGIIPARKDSRRVPNKNRRLLDDKELVRYTIEAAIESKNVNKDLLTLFTECIEKRW